MSDRAASEQVSITVDALEFDGLDVQEPARVQAAFQSELGRLVTAKGLPERLAASPAGASLEGGSIAAGDLDSPELLGRAVAQLVYQELSR